MPTKLSIKTDGEILTDLQKITVKITAFAWDAGDPKWTYAEALTDKEGAKICAYFSPDFKKTVDV